MQEVGKSEDLLKRDFTKAKDGKLYVSAIFDCYALMPNGLEYGIIQSMNSAGGRCHDNARCESIWARMKEELFYSRGDKSENYTMAELKNDDLEILYELLGEQTNMHC